MNRRRWLGSASTALGLSLVGAGRTVLAAPAKPSAVSGVGQTLLVGPSRAVRTLHEAARAARDGDTVLVDPGEYRGDTAVWTQPEVTIRGNGGRVVLIADGASAEGKGTFVFRRSRAVVEDFTFMGARASHRNGAGIRMDVGSRLTVHRCGFADNENGILTSNDVSSELAITDSTFESNGYGDGQSHNLYVGAINRLSISGCYLARCRVGHLLKSRAAESVVRYCRLTGEDGTSSYELDFPSGGQVEVLGCLVQQGAKTENSTLISYGTERGTWVTNKFHVSFCTIVNDRPQGGVFIRVPDLAGQVLLAHNLLVGSGKLDVKDRAATLNNAVADRAQFADAKRLDYRLRRSSRHVGAAGLAGGFDRDVLPTREYVHPATSMTLGLNSSLTPLSPGAFQRLAD